MTMTNLAIHVNKNLLSALAVVLFAIPLTGAHAPNGSATVFDPDTLIGSWEVELRPSPDAAPYYQVLKITAIDGNQIKGTFYDTPIKFGRINTAFGKVVFAFVTEDGSGVYNTSAVLVGDHLEGATHAVGRGFISPWKAERKQ